LKKQYIHAWTTIYITCLPLILSTNLYAQDTPLDLRRMDTLQNMDNELHLGAQDPNYPTPNRTLSNTTSQSDYQFKVLSIFALVQQGRTDASRVAEANQLLRYMIHHWPAYGQGDLVGQYASAWNHHSRNLGARIYFLYKDYMEPDILEDFENRLNWVVGYIQTSSSENIKMTTNALVYLGYEASNQTHLAGFNDIRSWIVNTLRSYGNNGFFEWGAPYHFWTLGGVLNLAEFAEDQEVRALANMVVDYTLGCMAGFSIGGKFNSAAIRKWYWTYGSLEPHTNTIQILFYQAPAHDYFLWVDWAASNYRPLSIVNEMYHDSYNSETYLTLVDRWHMYSYVMNRVAISTHHTLVDNYYGNPGETHDIAQCMIQSDGGGYNQIQTYAIHPTYSNKYRATHDRSFGYKNVAIVNGGGFTRKAWSAGTLTDVPIRLYYGNGFSVSFDSGWAFLSDGNAYVAWAPTVGDPIHDSELNDFLVSSHIPPDTGEAAVVEVGDPESFGSFTDFKNEIKTRNPRPRWNGKVVYTARDGTILEFGTNYAKVNGVAVDLNTYPRAESDLGILDYTFLMSGNQEIQFDFNNTKVIGPQDRMLTSRSYGFASIPPTAVIDCNTLYGAPPLEVIFDGSNSYDTNGSIVSYEWDFDNDGTIDATGPTVTHTYTGDGMHTCKLTVMDNENLTDSTTQQINVIANPIDNAAVVISTIPSSMLINEVVTVSVTMSNTGNTFWTGTDGYSLGAVGDSDYFAAIRHPLGAGEIIAPGQQKTFTFTMTAPPATGTYPTDWQMVKNNTSFFGAIHSRQVQVTDTVWVDLGTTDDTHGLYRSTDVGDGDTAVANIGGRECRTNEDPNSDFYMYYNVDDNYAYQGSRPEVYITLEYFDTGNESLTLQYDSSDTAPFPDDMYKSGGSIQLTDSNTWKIHTYQVTDAYFGNRQNGGADFRIFGSLNNSFYLDVVRVSLENPGLNLPTAVIDANPTSGNPPLEVNFDGSGSYDDDGSIVSYEWDFENDGTIDATGSSVSHIYATEGSYTARLKVTDDDGLVGSATIDISAILIRADFDSDGDVDQEDFGHLQTCMSGNGIPQTDPNCLNARLDMDEDIDLSDVAVFQACMSGANVPADPHCQD